MTTEFIPETDELIASLLVPIEYDADDDDDPLADYADGRQAALDQLRPGSIGNHPIFKRPGSGGS